MAEVSKEVSRSERAVLKWAEEPDFRAVVLRGIHAKALITLALYANGEVDKKEGDAALAIMKWMGVPKTPRAKKEPPVDDPEEDLGEFSREQLERLEGEE